MLNKRQMEMAKFWGGRKRKNFKSGLKERIAALPEEYRPLAEQVAAESSYEIRMNNVLDTAEKIMPLTDPGNPFLQQFYGADWAPFVAAGCKYKLGVIFHFGWFRRSLRSLKNPIYYNSGIDEVLRNFLQLQKYDLTPAEYLELQLEKPEYFDDDAETSWTAYAMSLMIAAELDRGNSYVQEKCREAIYGGDGNFSHPILMGLLLSGNEDNWKMLTDLLLAAKLQEGLRQSLIELCADGGLPVFKYFLKTIKDHNLLRFSSVVRAFCTWTGLLLEAERPATVKNAFELAVLYLEDAEARERALKEGNPLELYLALWALGNVEFDDAIPVVEKLLESTDEPLPRVCAGFYFVEQAGCPLLFDRVADEIKQYSNSPVRMGFVFRCFATEDVIEALDRGVIPAGAEEQQKIFEKFLNVVSLLPAKKQTPDNPVFSFVPLEYSSEPVWTALFLLAQIQPTAENIDRLVGLAPSMSTDVRRSLIQHLLIYMVDRNDDERWRYGMKRTAEFYKELPKRFQKSPVQRAFLFQSLEDKSTAIREMALNLISHLPEEVSDAEMPAIEALLRLKTASLRRKAVEMIMGSKHKAESVARLRASGNAEKIAAANEISPEATEEQAAEKWTAANGFGLFDPNKVYYHPEPLKAAPAYHPREIIKANFEAAEKLIKALDDLVHEHREYEYTQTYYDGSRTKVLLGNVTGYGNSWALNLDYSSKATGFDNYPLADIWCKFFADYNAPAEVLMTAYTIAHGFWGHVSDSVKSFYEVQKELSASRYSTQVQQLIFLQLDSMNPAELYLQITAAIAVYSPDDFWDGKENTRGYSRYFFREEAVNWWLTRFRNLPYSREKFNISRTLRLKTEKNDPEDDFNIAPLDDTLKANLEGWVPDEDVLSQLFKIGVVGMAKISYYPDGGIKTISSKGGCGWQQLSRSEFKFTAEVAPVIRRCIERILEIELMRGDLPTEVTEYVNQIESIESTCYFIRILAALGNYPLTRGCIWMSSSKQDVFSKLIRCTRPAPGENAETLRQELKGAKITKKRLLEAAMYNPQWLEIVADYLAIPELPLGAWYFHAHTSEQFNAEKETFVARYSQITPQEFNDGAFDIEWFRLAFDTLGEEMFDRLYDAAKYISGGTLHRRARIFADAALGRLSLKEIETQIDTKRNKDMVLAYGIVPDGDFRKRYERLQQFIKESRQFGAQRQTAEKRAAEVAIANLSRTAGFSDVNRFIWSMEGEKLKSLAPLFAVYEKDGVRLRLVIDSAGSADIECDKDGKALKSVPASLKKDSRVLEMNAAIKELREQQRRARVTLENAMIRGDFFPVDEVKSLSGNPVLAPLLNLLLWTDGAEIFRLHELRPNAKELKIAHPYDLLKSGRWAEFQQMAVREQLVQPFKQIFRELYMLTEDEKLDGLSSNRYAGHQVQPRKAVALLRTRGWTVDMEEGLQKVFHRENLIARIYAMADWFSPAEMESPTIEDISFADRRTGERVAFDKISPALFSETMRDADLMVSVAHAGGVDPEASHSTVEMRAALVGAMLPLFKLDNVRLEGSHAFIKGKFGEYTVHLGSGVCHKQAKGMVNIIPVHSQVRGRIFLPFADDDPKTAEVVTKILFLAEDSKIKDPNILNQIR